MESTIRVLSPLVKIRSKEDLKAPAYTLPKLLRGERTTFQIGLYFHENAFVKISKKASFPCDINIEEIQNAPVDLPAFEDVDEDYLTKEPCLMPDVLVPTKPKEYSLRLSDTVGGYFVSLNVPEDAKPGEYSISFRLAITINNAQNTVYYNIKLPVTILDAVVPKEKLLFTEWFYTDCIADYYQTGIYTKAHWKMIGKYMDAARRNGITMILVPVFTPALDTLIGTERPCTQLLDIEKRSNVYSFDFARLDQFIEMAKSKGFLAFEISHLFSQWGAKHTPTIVVKENGRKTKPFGWDTDSTSAEYIDFLKQLLPALLKHFRELGIFEQTYFHISDEPTIEAIDQYKKLRTLVKPLLEGRPIMDALSNLEFAKEGLVDIPVTATDHIGAFLEEHFENQWAYYCCGQGDKVANHFMAMPSYRNRISGIQLFKYDIKGFLQWGFNFYYAQYSTRLINPYLTTSSDKAFPSGDPFIVYPGNNGPLSSIRGLIFADALQDVRILQMAAEKVGKEKIVKLIDEKAGIDVTFDDYPRNEKYILDLMNEVKKIIAL